MKAVFSLLAGILFMSNMAFSQVKWSVDPAHTNARFEIKHLGIAFVDGEFTKLEGQAESKDSVNFDKGTVSFSIDVNSIDTRIEARDNHLKSDDFFSAEKFPKMTLSNATLTKAGKGKFKLTGDLTIKDVTKNVTFDVVQNNGTIIDPWGKTRAGFTAKTTINRFDYNIKYADKTPAGIDAVAPEVAITVNVELVKN
ncbi:YceI family protein [Sphingobacterium lactis]|uniref:Polyisoprenoid-binding protein YceI n=1 Tax=Sphingobacterium lactis TaxID=797291 RepID=A0A1H6BJP6_9SPHI|nr:YceI family protein [Sphingobacterium lactis]SEG60884.1 Polyisoprenoid-binding protein YceI [Sphingobacterium lactis]